MLIQTARLLILQICVTGTALAFKDPWEVFYGNDVVESRSIACPGANCAEPEAEGGPPQMKSDKDFCYSKKYCAPTAWKGVCNTGKFQSPIDLDIKGKTVSKHAQKAPILTFDKQYKANYTGFLISSNGHSITVHFNEESKSNSTFSHTDKHANYTFAQLHFHWATINTVGSEHTFAQKRFPMEMHLVHYKSMYEGLGHALQENDEFALAVLGIVFKIGEKENLAMKPIIDAMETYKLNKELGTSISTDTINLYELLPKKRSFFRYKGSLTTPSCIEKIQWVVFTEPVAISVEQLGAFRDIESNYEEDFKLRNYRPIQKLNGRKIEYFN